MKTILSIKKISIISFILFIQYSNTFAQEVLYYCSRPLPSGTGAWQVYKKNLTSGVIDTITSNPLYNYWWVELSPNHNQLVMLRSPYSGPTDQYDYANCEMIKSNADGSNEQIILNDNQYGWFAFGNPHWHPSGNRILMIAQPTNSTQPFYVVTVDTSGNNPSLITTQWSIDANWSPLGNKIVFIGLGTLGIVPLNFEVFTANYNYTLNQISNIQQLTSDTTRNQDPCFSPDGSKIVFSASKASITNADLVTIDTSGANRTAILDDNGVHGGPLNWGTDGKIYHHSIYLFTTNFTVNAFNTNTNLYETFFVSPSYGYISPYYANLTTSSLSALTGTEQTISVYPNPTTNEIRILLPASNQYFVIEIYSSIGQRLLITTEKTTIDMSNFTNGIYMLRVKQGDKFFTSKILKQ
jgi:Tol biopolymer transport system component